MAEFRTVRMLFWHDPFVEEMDAKGKLLYIYLFTGPYANNLGIVEATRRKISYETALTQQEVDKYLAEFEGLGKVVCDPEHNLIFMTNFIRHQTSTSPKMLDGLSKMTISIQSATIAKAVCVRYPHLYGYETQPIDTVSIPYANGRQMVDIPSAEFGSWKLEDGNRKYDPTDHLSANADSPPNCPQQEILNAYHELLSELPKMKVWGDERTGHMRTRWRERWKAQKYRTQEEGIAYFRRLFAYIRDSDFLMGRTTDRHGKSFMASLDWIVLPRNFAKIIEGRYHDKKMDTAA